MKCRATETSVKHLDNTDLNLSNNNGGVQVVIYSCSSGPWSIAIRQWGNSETISACKQPWLKHMFSCTKQICVFSFSKWVKVNVYFRRDETDNPQSTAMVMNGDRGLRAILNILKKSNLL